MGYVKISKLEIEYEQAGKGPNVIVLVHGNFASWRWWHPFLKRVPRGFRAIAPVTRGCGNTVAGQDNFSIKRLAKDLLLFAKAMDLSRFHLVGHSLGGAIVTQFALDYPQYVKTLTLVAPAPPDGLKSLREDNRPETREPVLFSTAAWPLYQQLHAMGNIFGFNRYLLENSLGKMMPTLPDDYRGFRQLVDDAQKLSPATIRGFYRALDRWNVTGKLCELSTPTRILWGELDTIIPKKALKELDRSLPNSRLLVWQRTGHSPQLEQPEKFVNFLIGFIGKRSLSAFAYWILHAIERGRRYFLHHFGSSLNIRRLLDHR